MGDRQQQLLDQIDTAFAGVDLGDGVSMHETQIIDSYGTREQRVAARTPDEKFDWHKLIDDPDLPWLFGHAGGLSFIDDEGLRFYLPACLSLGVLDPVRADEDNMLHLLVWHHSDPATNRLKHLEGFNEEQRNCVRDAFAHFRRQWESEDSELR